MAQIPRNGDMAALERAFANARDAGATAIRCGMLSGRRYETFATLEAWNAWVQQSQDALKPAVPLAEKYRVALAIENHKDWTTEQYVGISRLTRASIQQAAAELAWSRGSSAPGCQARTTISATTFHSSKIRWRWRRLWRRM
jgi:hypothetical protein